MPKNMGVAFENKGDQAFTAEGVHLKAGETTIVPTEDAKRFVKHPAVKARIEAGTIVPGDEEVEIAVAPGASTKPAADDKSGGKGGESEEDDPIHDMNAREAIEAVAKLDDEERLHALRDKEDRTTVIEAIDKRLAGIK